jgi:hypothetical protein
MEITGGYKPPDCSEQGATSRRLNRFFLIGFFLPRKKPRREKRNESKARAKTARAVFPSSHFDLILRAARP